MVAASGHDMASNRYKTGRWTVTKFCSAYLAHFLSGRSRPPKANVITFSSKDDVGYGKNPSILMLHSNLTANAIHLPQTVNKIVSMVSGQSCRAGTYKGISRVISRSDESIAKAAFQVGISHIDGKPCNQQELMRFLSCNTHSVHNACDFLDKSDKGRPTPSLQI